MSTDNFNNNTTGGYSSGYNTYNNYARTYGQTTQYPVTAFDRTASWCSNCGRKRGNDGRCPDCDPWWTSPIVQYGGPACLLVTLLLLAGIALTQPRPGTVSVRTVLTTNTVVQPTFMSSNYASYAPPPVYNPPVYTPPSMPTVNFAAMPPSTEELQWRAIEQLRQVTAYTDAAVEQQRQARWQQYRATYDEGARQNYGGGESVLLANGPATVIY